MHDSPRICTRARTDVRGLAPLRVLLDDYALLNSLRAIIAQSWLNADGFPPMLNRQAVSRARI